jgi:hypothetical protein
VQVPYTNENYSIFILSLLNKKYLDIRLGILKLQDRSIISHSLERKKNLIMHLTTLEEFLMLSSKMGKW